MIFSRTITKAPALAPEQTRPVAEDVLLVERVRQGETLAFEQLTRKYRERLYAVLYNLTAHREDAADLTQEAFIKAFQNIHTFKGKSSFYTWLYRIGVNAAYSHLKKTRRNRFFSFEKIHEEALQAEILDKVTQAPQQDRRALLEELREKLNEALQTLSLKHRTVVVLHEIEGLSHREIAEVMNSTEGTVRSRLHYAKQQLQSQLHRYL